MKKSMNTWTIFVVLLATSSVLAKTSYPLFPEEIRLRDFDSSWSDAALAKQAVGEQFTPEEMSTYYQDYKEVAGFEASARVIFLSEGGPKEQEASQRITARLRCAHEKMRNLVSTYQSRDAILAPKCP